MKTVIVTGAAGFIGGQTVLRFKAAGYRVIGIDRRTIPTHLEGIADENWRTDFVDTNCLHMIAKSEPVAIIHCAGTSLVGPSVTDPDVYYENNFIKTKQLLDYLKANRLTNIQVVFSSSAAVYGEPVMVPVSEEDPTLPISPYGESKLMVEFLLKSYYHAYHQQFTAFRYFNVAGADPEGRHGNAKGGTHIMSRLLESVKEGTEFVLYGTDYPTADGTCIRDYIHVADLAEAHLLAVEKDVAGIYNLSSLQGVSNKQVIAAVEQVTGIHPAISTGAARPGDPAELTASSARFNSVTGWQPQYSLTDMLTHAWAWYNR